MVTRARADNETGHPFQVPAPYTFADILAQIKTAQFRMAESYITRYEKQV
jgi:hypothetical protein